jgi:hypothetical protein
MSPPEPLPLLRPDNRPPDNVPVPEAGPPPLEAAPIQTAPLGPGAVVGQVFGQVVTAAAEQAARVVRPEAAVAVAAEFTFPLALALAVLIFLVIQEQVDRRDPKLRMAPQHVGETWMQFQSEDQL